MFSAGSKEAMVIQALKFMGQKHIDKNMQDAAKRFLKGTTRREFERNIKFAPRWIRVLLLDLMENEL